jgi:hypothetical protein
LIKLPLLSSVMNSTLADGREAHTSTAVNYYPSIHMVICSCICVQGRGLEANAYRLRTGEGALKPMRTGCVLGEGSEHSGFSAYILI